MSKIQVPLLDLKAQWVQVKDEVEQAVQRVLDSQMFIMGPEVTAMEEKIAEYCQAKHCIGVSSGTDALLLTLMALDVKPGDEIITTPYTFFATAGSIARVGATPVFVDIDPVSFNIDPSQIEAKVTRKTRGIMPIHLYGQCAEMDPILAIAARRSLFVIEDACQAIGAEYKGRRAGAMGTAGCFSFFPSKNLGAAGDAGAVTTNDDALAERIRLFRVHGSKPKYYHSVVGGNFRIDAIQSAVLSAKLRHLDSWTASRQVNAQRYRRLFFQHGLAPSLVQLPTVVQDRHIFNQYIIRVVDRDALQKHLTAQGIGNEIYYPVPLHMQECFMYLGCKAGDFPESEKAAASTLALPIYPELTEEQQARVVAGVADFYAASGRLSTSRAA